jgi:hypothetical protein
MIDEIRLVQGTLVAKPVAPTLPKPDAQTLQQIERRAADVQGSRIAARRWCGWARAWPAGVP